jgi:hypothetical protein
MCSACHTVGSASFFFGTLHGREGGGGGAEVILWLSFAVAFASAAALFGCTSRLQLPARVYIRSGKLIYLRAVLDGGQQWCEGIRVAENLGHVLAHAAQLV